MAIQGEKRCPYCGSLDVSQTVESYAGHAIKGTVAASASVAGGVLIGTFKKKLHLPGPSGAGKIYKGIVENGSYDFKCNKCDRVFLIKFRDNKITEITGSEPDTTMYYMGKKLIKNFFK